MSDIRPVPEVAEAMGMACAVAAEAAGLLREAAALGGPMQVRSKSSLRDLVTEWDTRCEDLIRERLSVLTPAIPLLGEERGGSEAGGADRDYLWLADPIDGTVNFCHGLPLFSVVLALEHRGQPVVGVVYAPALGWQFYGCLGGGAFMNGTAMEVSAVARLDQAMLASGFPYDRATNPDNNFVRWEHFQRRAGACRRLGAASLDLCMVARGWLDGYWEARLHPWDLSAGALLVREAGGVVTGLFGEPFASAKGEAVASNGIIHPQILAELAAIDARPDSP